MGNNNSRKDSRSTTVARPPQQEQPLQPRCFKFPIGSRGLLGVTKYAPPPEPIRFPPQPLRLQPPAQVEAPSSYKLWSENYYPGRVRPDEYEALSSRISDKTNELALERERDLAEKCRLARLREENRLFTERKPTPQPKISLNSFMPINQVLETIKKNDKKYFSTEGELPELTPDILDVINEASRPDPLDELLVKIDDVEILRKDIQKLLRLNWLNDEIINAYMLLLVRRGSKTGNKSVYTFNTFFYPKLRENGYSSIRRWTRKVDIFSYDYVLVPIHLGNHWCLALIDFTSRIISYYDSLGGHPNGCCDTLLDYLRDESKDKKKQDFDDENWRLVNSYSDGIPQQKNCSDCGVFACTYAEYLTRQAKLNFRQEHMPYFRKKMIYEIITQQILE